MYAITRTIVPIRVRTRLKLGIARNTLGKRLLEKIDQENFFAQASIILNIYGYEIVLPERHHLKLILEREPLRESLLAQASKILLQSEDDKFIDIGANVGDTAAVIYGSAAKTPNSILIEPSEFFFGYLKNNQKNFPKSLLMQNFVAHEHPIQNLKGSLHHWGGTAKFIEDTDVQHSEHVPQIDLIEIIDERVKLIKIDCDGMDFRILKSTIPRLQNNYPAFYFENEITSLNQLHESMEVIELFEKAGYRHVIVARNCGTLIYGGEIGENLSDILQLQYALHAQGLRSAIYYTDILIFNSDQRPEYMDTLGLMRENQRTLMNRRIGSL
jgi:hypothetical protein